MVSISHLCLSVGIEIELEPFNCALLLQGFGDKSVDARPTFAMSTLHGHDEKDAESSIHFCGVDGTRPKLIGLDFLAPCDILGEMNKIEIPAGAV